MEKQLKDESLKDVNGGKGIPSYTEIHCCDVTEGDCYKEGTDSIYRIPSGHSMLDKDSKILVELYQKTGRYFLFRAPVQKTMNYLYNNCKFIGNNVVQRDELNEL